MSLSFLFLLNRNHKPSTVHVERLVDCPFSLALDEADEIFPMLGTSVGGVRIPFRSFRLPLPGAFTHPVSVQIRRQNDVTEQGRVHDEIAFEWQAHSGCLPDFSGVLHFRIEYNKTRIILDGNYLPPYGVFGSYFDQMIGQHLAHETASDLMSRIATLLEVKVLPVPSSSAASC